MNVVKLYPQLYFCGTYGARSSWNLAASGIYNASQKKKNEHFASQTTEHKQSSGQDISLGLPLQAQGTDGQASAAGSGRECLNHEANPRFRSIAANTGTDVLEDSQVVEITVLPYTHIFGKTSTACFKKKSYLKGPNHKHGDNRVQWRTLHDSGIKHPRSSLRLDLSVLAVEHGAAFICRAIATHHSG